MGGDTRWCFAARTNASRSTRILLFVITSVRICEKSLLVPGVLEEKLSLQLPQLFDGVRQQSQADVLIFFASREQNDFPRGLFIKFFSPRTSTPTFDFGWIFFFFFLKLFILLPAEWRSVLVTHFQLQCCFKHKGCTLPALTPKFIFV